MRLCVCVCVGGACVCVFRAHIRPVRRGCAYPSLKVGDCVTLSSRLSSEPRVCHVGLLSVRAEKRGEELLLAVPRRRRHAVAGRRNK